MIKRSFAFVLCFLFIFSILIPINLGDNVNTYIENKPESNTSQMMDKPPLPPLAWTEDFSTIYLMIPGDSGGDHVYYFIDWGDSSVEEWIGPYASGEIISLSHLWDNGEYIIKIKVRTSNGDSQWATYCLTLSTYFKFFHPNIGYIGLAYKFTIYYEDYGLFIFDWGDGTKSCWNTGIAIPHIWDAPGEYSFRWKAKDEFGHQTTWSDPTIIEILQLESQQPPNKTDIDGPTRGKPGEELCWTFHSTDPDGDDIKYIIDWGDGNNEETDCYPSCTPVTVCHTYGEEGVYEIKVRAQKCPNGLTGPESTLSLTIPRKRTIMDSCWLKIINMFPLMQRLLNLI